MKFLFSFLLLSSILVACSDKPDPEAAAEVRGSFAGYKHAVIAVKGSDALRWVDSGTLAYYDRLIALATTADSATVRALDLQDRFMVLSIRHTIPKEAVLGMNGSGLFTYAIEHGMIGEGNVGDIAIGDVAIQGDSARGTLVIKGDTSALYFRFNREAGKWKIDLTSLFGSANEAFKKMLVQSGKNEDAFIAEMLEFQTDKKPGPEIWQPLK